jgi:hypothetical protein
VADDEEGFRPIHLCGAMHPLRTEFELVARKAGQVDLLLRDLGGGVPWLVVRDGNGVLCDPRFEEPTWVHGVTAGFVMDFEGENFRTSWILRRVAEAEGRRSVHIDFPTMTERLDRIVDAERLPDGTSRVRGASKRGTVVDFFIAKDRWCPVSALKIFLDPAEPPILELTMLAVGDSFDGAERLRLPDLEVLEAQGPVRHVRDLSIENLAELAAGAAILHSGLGDPALRPEIDERLLVEEGWEVMERRDEAQRKRIEQALAGPGPR